MVNFSTMHGVKASLTYDKTGSLKEALDQSNPEVAPHPAFADFDGHGYSAVRASSHTLETEFVCIPPPLERSPSDDGGPVVYRVRFRANIWQSGQAPTLEREVIEGALPFSAGPSYCTTSSGNRGLSLIHPSREQYDDTTAAILII